MTLTFAAPSSDSRPLYLVSEDAFPDWHAARSEEERAWLDINGFTGQLGKALMVPSENGPFSVVGYGSGNRRKRGRFHLAAGLGKLPPGTYALESDLSPDSLANEALGCLLSGYAFDRYKSKADNRPILIAPDAIDANRIEAIAAGEKLTRDLINTPASDMGPAELEESARQLAHTYGANIDITVGDALLEQNYPMIHAVGRASDQAPRLIDMRWGNTGPRLTLVGKGVCFDTGGLNLKPGGSMGLMKKDMGGSAAVLGLAQMIMSLGLGVQLRVLVPAVENAVSGNAFRPQDILASRKGLTVEINNTDAEGRLVLADALALADEEKPDMIISMATLTGAARVAVGPDLAPFYADNASHADAIAQAGDRVADPVWRMPFHDPYESMIEPDIADLDNAPKGGFAGSITAALFLKRFVTESPYVHFDIYGWQPNAAPGRPKGGVGQGTRAVLEALPDLVGI